MTLNKKRGDPDRPTISLYWLCLGLGLLIFIFYFDSFTAALLFDSEIIIKMDPRIREVSFTNLERILTRDYWWPSQESILYRPLTTFSYMFNYAILGNAENVAGYHAVNFLLHWANAWLVFLIIRRLAGRLDIAVFTASLFAVHPVNTEAVTNIVGRADLLAAFFVLLAGWSYLRAENRGVWDKRWLVLTAVAACSGVLAKENAVMVAGFILLCEWLWKERVRALVHSWPAYVAIVPSILLITVIRQWTMSTTTVFEDFFLDNPLVGATLPQRFITGAGIIGRYLKLLLFPGTLSSDYSFNQIPLYGTGNSGSDALAWISLVVAAVLLLAAVLLRTRHRIVSWGILFFFIMLLPTSNLIITIGSIMADRFLYLPSIGFCAAAAAIMIALSRRVPPILRRALPVVLVAVLGVRTFVRNADWQDDTALWKSTVAASPESYKAHMIYGNTILAVAERNNIPLSQVIDDAIAEEETARSIVDVQPALPLKWQNVMVYLHLAKDYRMKGQFLDDSGRHDEGVRLYQTSLDILGKAQEIDRETNRQSHEFRQHRGLPTGEIPDAGNYLVYESLCFTYAKFGDWEKCVAVSRYLQHLAPQQPSGYQLLGTAFFNLGRYPEAAEQFLAGMLVDPQKPDWLTSLSATYEKLGVQPNPVTNLGNSLALNKDLPITREQINQAAAIVVRLYEQAGKQDDARELQERLIKQYSLAPEVFSRKS